MGENGWLSSRGRRIALGTVAALALWFLLDALIVTERERVEARIESMRAALAARRIEELMAGVADDYQHGGADKAGLERQATGFVSGYDPDRVSYTIQNVSISGDRAEVDGICLVVPGQRTQYPAPFRGRVRLSLRRDADEQWRLTAVERER